MGKSPLTAAVAKSAGKPADKKPKKSAVDSNKKQKKVVTKSGKPSKSVKSDKKTESQVDRKRRLFKQYSDLLRADSDEERHKIVAAVLADVKGAAELPTFVQSHAGSRLVQACLKYGTEEQRQFVIRQFTPEDTKTTTTANSYGLLAVEKLVNYGDKKFVLEALLEPLIAGTSAGGVGAVEGVVGSGVQAGSGGGSKKLTSMLFHRTGSRFVEFIYTHKELPSSLKRRIVEILGTRMLVKSGATEFVKRCVDKELLHMSLVHRMLKLALIEKYPKLLDEEEDAKIPIEALPQLLGSREGVEVLLEILPRLQTKEKKQLIKNDQLKNKYAEIAENSVCSIFLLKLLEVVDDTVLTGKSVLSELLDKIDSLAFSQFGRAPFLYLLTGMNPGHPSFNRYFVHDDRKLLLNAVDTTVTHKKTNALKAKELLAKASPVLEAFVRSNFARLAQDVHAKDLVVEVLLSKISSESSGSRHKFLEHCLESLFASPDLSVHAVTVLLVLLKQQASSLATALALNGLLLSRGISDQLLLSRWSFVLLELAKNPDLLSEDLLTKFKATLKTMHDLPASAKAASALAEAVAKATARLDLTAAVTEGDSADEKEDEHEEEEDDGLVMMDDE